MSILHGLDFGMGYLVTCSLQATAFLQKPDFKAPPGYALEKRLVWLFLRG
jgi:hypothetical protein